MFGTIELGGGSFQYRQLLAYSLQPKSLKLLKEAVLPATACPAEDFKGRAVCN